MKPAAFTYHAPSSSEEVDDVLGELGGEAKVLAGGQSLVPILNMRLMSPAHVVDINRLEDTAHEPAHDGDHLVVGPLVRQAAVEASHEAAERLPLLRATLRFVAHPAVRSRGTIAGSIAHADPAAELPALLVALRGSVVARARDGRRAIGADDFFAGPFETALRVGEWVESVRLPCPQGCGYAVDEVARRHGDYALCGVIAVATAEADLALTYFGVGDRPVRVELGDVSGGEVATAVRAAVADVLEPPQDLHAGSELRMRLAATLGARAGRRALDQVAA